MMQTNLMQRMAQALRKDGWLLCALLAVVMLCLATGTSSSTGATPEELRLAQVLSAIEGAGRVEVAIYYDSGAEASPCGAVIVSEGAGDIATRLRLTRAVTALLGVDVSRVEVFQREGGSSHEQLDP